MTERLPDTLSPADASPVLWSPDGAPRSRLFDDIYFSTADGLAESRAVFLDGCGLPDAWRGRNRFVVGELGFGSGLNILALLELWRRTREPGARLHIVSVEAFPLPAEDARRALAAWPDLEDLAEPLLAGWPGRARGFHRVEFANLDAVLDLAVLEVGEALEAWRGAADAWFLDGFSPAKNPAMWRQEVLDLVAARSAPGARAATFTVAGAVRRGLSAAGFTVEKQPGFGRKAERLEARLSGAETAPKSRAKPRIAVIGAGIAGASLNRAFRALGVEAVLIEAEGPGAGASGNPAALVMPRLDAGGGPVAQLYAQSLERAADLYDLCPEAVIAGSAVQLETGPKDSGRFDRIAEDDLFETDAMARLSAAEVEARLGEPASAGLLIRDARVVEPARVLDAWLDGAPVLKAMVERLEPSAAGWRLIGADGAEVMRADVVVLAAGAGAARLAPGLPLSLVRGQVSVAEPFAAPATAIGEGYVIPTRTGLLFGATHDRGDTGAEPRDEDHRRNLDQLALSRPRVAETLRGRPLKARASLRAVTPDFLPVAGAVPQAAGLFILSGLGSRGFCAAPLLAEHVAALALGFPSPLPAALSEIVDPARFDRRRSRRLGRSMRASAKTEL